MKFNFKDGNILLVEFDKNETFEKNDDKTNLNVEDVVKLDIFKDVLKNMLNGDKDYSDELLNKYYNYYVLNRCFINIDALVLFISKLNMYSGRIPKNVQYKMIKEILPKNKLKYIGYLKNGKYDKFISKLVEYLNEREEIIEMKFSLMTNDDIKNIIKDVKKLEK